MSRWGRHWELKIMAVLLATFLWFALRVNAHRPLPTLGPPPTEAR
ncbi:MAG TPA: hypothetical protein PKZ00_10280 [Elusimicrobiota bacterium]|nr:hypothetical protein [Elusimicrobiota bacterium]HNC75525.1 hypothetical protein [Elusimicrobiota bacterium]HNI57960.1 hypothetical protein [Elusimicrobiota bacterium]